MLVSASGVSLQSLPPAPSEATELRVRSVLATLDSLLDIMWMPMVWWDARNKRYEGRYALVCRWPQIDSRWSMVQSNEIAPSDALDIIGWLCEDMQDAQSMPMTEAAVVERVVALLGSMDNTRYPWKQRMLGTVANNAKVHEDTKADAVDRAVDEAEYRYRQVKGVPQSVGADFNSEGKLV